MRIGKSVPIIERGHFCAVPTAEQTGVDPGVCRKSFLASELTHLQKHLTSRSSRLLRSLGRSALRTCSGMASPLFPEQALRAKRRLPRR